uniref:chloride channel CLIC-like protein 1 isoform X2 n=1 Tax=Scatophagus argus TaxID=75038 RepID=UPI001ED86045|nr:chloride channel CLIC-like protein 1 isoform X2 [Scatophagus argus]
MKCPPLPAGMLLTVLVCYLSLAATEQQVEDDWIDPYDMLNYDASTKTMRKPAEVRRYPDLRRAYNEDSSQQTPCEKEIVDLHKKIEEQNERIKLISQQPTCSPVFKRFLSRLLKEIQRVGLPSDSADVFYDAKVKLSKQSTTEIQTLLDGEESWRTGALDNAISQILVDLRPHDYVAWKWRFEDTFGVELDTILKMGIFVLVVVAIVCTQLWSVVSWFVQIKRLLIVAFLTSILWNWFYLYKLAFAEHQKKMVELDGISEKCTGVKKIDWSDSLKEWIRVTWTLRDDPCQKYYEVLFVNPFLLVPPTKAISVTIVTFITEPMKHIGEGISDFIRALLKDLPATLQIPVFATIVLCIVLFIVVFTYGSVQAAFQHGITAPFRRPRRDPPPRQLPQPQRRLQEIEDYGHVGEGDAPRYLNQGNGGRGNRNLVHQRPLRREPPQMNRGTLHTGERPFSEDEADAPQCMAVQNLSAQNENVQDTEEEPAGASASSAAANTAQSTSKTKKSDSSQSKTEPLKESKNLPKDDGRASKSQQAKGGPSETGVQDPNASAEDATSSHSMTRVETLGVPVQETQLLE